MGGVSVAAPGTVARFPEGRPDPSAAPLSPADRLVAWLKEAGAVDEAGLERARRLQQSWGGTLHDALSKLALVSERDMAAAFAAALELKLIGEDDYPAAPVVDIGHGLTFLKDRRAVAVHADGAGVLVALADPLDEVTIQALQMLLQRPVLPAVGVPAEIEAALDRLHGEAPAAVDPTTPTGEEDGDAIERLRDLALEAPVIRLVNDLIARAVEARASDIHVEPFEGALRVRFRIDGVLQDVDHPPWHLRAAIISRIKILARLDIAERRLPQDGRIRTTVRGKSIDLRVATAPCVHGESAVLRVLDHGSVEFDLERLGFSGTAFDRLTAALERPNSIVLVTGPTGSGKTTTLYAALRRVNTVHAKIITIEDPIEYQLHGIIQVQVQPEIDLTFARQLRANLRHDPDVMMVGEIRDLETMQIAMQAALTGHLVLSTVHTNGAAATIARLVDMGAERYLLTATLGAICAQRLVRRLCPDCRTPIEPDPGMADALGLDYRALAAARLHRPVGCGRCNQTGYRGRISIAEVLTLSDGIRGLIAANRSAAEIHEAAVAEGMLPLFKDGMNKVRAGETTVAELLRVTGEA